jgi:hypothetical protein
MKEKPTWSCSEGLRLYVNFFLPSHQLKEKIRRGSRVTKRYHPARTPYGRVLASAEVSAVDKRRLRARYRELNPAELHRRIRDFQEQLLGRTSRARAAGGRA